MNFFKNLIKDNNQENVYDAFTLLYSPGFFTLFWPGCKRQNK